MPFAEIKKADLGGPFWVSQLNNIFVANVIYVLMMCGVISGRYDPTHTTYSPVIICSPCMVFVVWSWYRFQTAFSWESLPISRIIYKENGDGGSESKETFRHP